MATFTMTLQEIRENNPAEDFGLNSYPIFDEKYRAGLNQKIFDQYANREIGAETVQEFRKWMKRKMSQIMPYYNQMYLSERLRIDPLNTVNMSTVVDSTGDSTANGVMSGTSTSTGTSDQTTTAESKSRSVDMVTPQNELAGQGDYATGAQDNISSTNGGSNAENAENSSSDTTSDTTANTTSHMENKVSGYSGSQAILLNEFRKTFLNIDMEIIDDLAILFMQVWTSGDSYTRNERSFYNGYTWLW